MKKKTSREAAVSSVWGCVWGWGVGPGWGCTGGWLRLLGAMVVVWGGGVRGGRTWQCRGEGSHNGDVQL